MKSNVWIKYYKNGKLKESLTFEYFEYLVNNKIQKINNYGIRKNDRVIIQNENSPNIIATYFALKKLNIIAIPISPDESPRRINYIKENSSANAIINTNDEVILFKNNGKSSIKNIEKVSTIIYTSGTTGEPKGVCLGNDNWLENAKTLIKHHCFDQETIFASPLPIFHCNAHGLSMHTTFISKSRLILFNKITTNFLDIIKKEQVNVLSIVPTILYRLFKKKPEWIPNKELSYILTAAAPLPGGLLKDILEKWKIKVIQGYGLSESTNFSCTMPLGCSDEKYRKIMFPHPSIGIALPGVEVSIKDKNNEGIIGELLVKSKSNFLGYWGKPIKPADIVETGDLAYYRSYDGVKFYYLVGRIKETINRAGETISPVEIERELISKIKNEFVVFSIPDIEYNEEIGLACKKSFDYSILEELPYRIRPKKVFIVKEFFYTPTGKIQRKKLANYCLNKITENIDIKKKWIK
jgi:acyl-CoA synthetase (AMP-forming)/AMP-acid ligase II